MGEFLAGWPAIFGDRDTFSAQVARELIESIPKLDALGPCEPALRTLAAYDARTFEPGARQLAVDALWLAEAQEDLGRHAEAIAGFEAGFERFSEGSLPSRSRSAYGAALAAEQRFDEAQDMLLMAFDDAVGPAERGRTAARLVALYEAWGNPDEAETWRQLAAE